MFVLGDAPEHRKTHPAMAIRTARDLRTFIIRPERSRCEVKSRHFAYCIWTGAAAKERP